MHGQPTGSLPPDIATALSAARDTDTDRTDSTQAAILHLLLGDDHHGLWSRAELHLALSAGPLTVNDALADLLAAGLAHELGDFILASWAARSFDRLDL
jgi:hypothetical protein